MNTLFEDLEERKNSCKTIGDWKQFAEHLIELATELNHELLATQAAVLDNFGNEILEKIESQAEEIMEENFPLDISAYLFGYQNENIVATSQKSATELFKEGREVWLLNADNTEKLATSENDIENHRGMFGITLRELERIAKESDSNSERE